MANTTSERAATAPGSSHHAAPAASRSAARSRVRVDTATS